MTTEINPKRRRLFLSYLYPSFFGTGPQIRAASLLHMLAAREDVYLLVILPQGNSLGARDLETEKMCKKVEFISLLPDGHEGPVEKIFGPTDFVPAVKASEISVPLLRYCAENSLDWLFAYRFESCYFLKGLFQTFPRRFLDVDELASRRLGKLDQLKSISSATTSEPTDRRFQFAVRMMEKEFVGSFEKIFASSEIEADEVRRLTGHPQVHALPNIAPPRIRLMPPPLTEPREILFVGSFAYFPNVDAVLHFYREIFPLVQEQLDFPVRFRIVGAPCPESLQEMGKDPKVSLMGRQKDLDPLYNAASLAVVPLRAGAGTRIKILEAFAYGRPVVSTRIGAEGLMVTDQENLLLADHPSDFAHSCVQILADPTLALRLVENAEIFHRECHSPETLLRCYDEQFGD